MEPRFYKASLCQCGTKTLFFIGGSDDRLDRERRPHAVPINRRMQPEVQVARGGNAGVYHAEK
ncbi:hypothetical protein [Bacillus daqingensis]|uniref:hypothetical protein n=1 Tax=Bacillus daqingensis TaxID=872396 RepID=UPI003F82443E